MAPADLGEGGAGLALAPDRPVDFLETFVRPEVRHHRPGEEFSRRQRPGAGLGAQDQPSLQDLRDQRQLRGGVGVRELPPTVPRLRVCVWPTKTSAWRSKDTRAASVSSRATTHWRAQAPIRTASVSKATNFNAAISLMSISQLGRSSRNAIMDEALSARNDLGGITVPMHELAGLLDRGCAGIFKGGRFQWTTSTTLPDAILSSAFDRNPIGAENHGFAHLWGATQAVHNRGLTKRISLAQQWRSDRRS